MHEASLVAALMDQVLAEAKERCWIAVEEIEVDIGRLRQVVPEFFENAFESAKKGTMAEQAVLQMNEIKAEAECLSCHRTFEPEPDDLRCPGCGVADARILKGDAILLRSISGYEKEKGRS